MKRQKVAPDGSPLCKVRKCYFVALTTAEGRGMCEMHYRTHNDGRGRCSQRGCRRLAIQPYTDRLCESHHPRKQALTPLQSLVVEQMDKGANPIAAVQMVTGIEDKAKAARKLEKMAESAPFQYAVSQRLAGAGLTDDHIYQSLRENVDARNIQALKLKEDGEERVELVDVGKDYRASNAALDMVFRLRGEYAPKQVTHQGAEKTTFNVAVMVPPEKNLDRDAPIHVIKAVD